MSKRMSALTFVRKGRLEWRDAPAPQLHGPHEALVRPIVASRCDGDCLFLFHDFSRALQLGAALHVIDPEVRELGDRPFAGPFAYGHECIAEVIDVGDAVRGVTIGQRVVPYVVMRSNLDLVLERLSVDRRAGAIHPPRSRRTKA